MLLLDFRAVAAGVIVFAAMILSARGNEVRAVKTAGAISRVAQARREVEKSALSVQSL